MAIWGWGKSKRKASDKAALSLAEARLKRGDVLLSDLHELKTTIAEARYENDFSSAKAAFMRKELEVSAALLEEIRATYAGVQSATLRRDALGLPKKEARLLTKQQSTIRKILKQFDDVTAGLHLAVSRELARQGTRPGAASAATERLPAGFVDDFGVAKDADTQADIIEKYFCSIAVHTTGDVKPGTLYGLRQGDSIGVLITADHFPTNHHAPVSDVVSGKRLRPLSIQDCLTLGGEGQLVELQLRERQGTLDADTSDPNDRDSTGVNIALDMAAFNQLVLAAERSGLISNIPIRNARDQYFRRDQYQHCYGAIERAYLEFNSKAADRMAKLRDEERAYRRGLLKMTLREWQKKQQQDAAQTQCVERARRHFKLVLDGLRILHFQQQTSPGASGL